MLEKLILKFKTIMIDTSSISHNKNKLSEILHPINSIYCTSENKNPSTFFGGEWELVDKEFKEQIINKDITITKDNISNYNCQALLKGHIVHLRTNFTTKVPLADTQILLCTVDWNQIGLKGLSFNHDIIFGCDSGDGIINATYLSNGNLNSNDIIAKGGGSTLATGTSGVNVQNIVSTMNNMIDDFCDKFYWKRIA